MQYTPEIFSDWMPMANSNINYAWPLAYMIVCGLCVGFGLGVFYKRKKRKGEGLYFLFLCGAVLLWSVCCLLDLLWAGGTSVLLTCIGSIGLAFSPGLIYLHVCRQVSYKEINWKIITLTLMPSAIIAVFWALPYVGGSLFAGLQAGTPCHFVIGGLFFLCVFYLLLKSCFLCVSVFYQRPRHMRTTAWQLSVGIIISLVATVAQIWPGGFLGQGVLIAAACVALPCFFQAFYLVSATDVIVTGRDLVFGALSTTILVLSKNQNILDWNKKGRQAIYPLPEPIYRESFAAYRQRIIREGNGCISAHWDNIITTSVDGSERHHLITTHEIQGKRLTYGYIVEISEVTHLYTILHHLEEISMIDQLTGLYNRNAYLNMVAQLVQPENMPLVVMVGDVNGLKQLNDIQGHLSGDALLTTVAGIIRACVPRDAFAARIGGDEFVLLFSGEEAQARQFVTNMEGRCAQVKDARFGTPSISWGYAIMRSSDEIYNEVFARADKIMYEFKRAHFKFRSSGFVPAMDAAPAKPQPSDTGDLAAAAAESPPPEPPAE